MTKNILRLGLVLSLCGAMAACKKSEVKEDADDADSRVKVGADAAKKKY